VWTVALLPDPWKASKVGFTGPLFEPIGGSLGVRYVAFWEDDIVVVDGWVGKGCMFLVPSSFDSRCLVFLWFLYVLALPILPCVVWLLRVSLQVTT
jgi:hypothetical protein